MVTNKYRPKVLDEVDGQPLAVDLLKRFAANPDQSPKCLLLYGSYGTGKTSAARAFAHAVNGVTHPAEHNDYITEYNCTSLEYEAKNAGGRDKNNRPIGMSVEAYLTDYLTINPDRHNIVILDEIQGASEYAQTSMLKYIERDHKKRFFIFCTTEMNKVLPTIRSRCLSIEFKSISYNDVYKNLDKCARAEGIDVPGHIKAHIATRCNGHMRDAHIELQKCITVGVDNYIANSTSYYGLISDMFIAAHKGDKDSLVHYLKELSFNPLFTVKSEFENFIVDCSTAKYTGQQSQVSEVNRLLDEYGEDFTSIVNFYTGIWDNSLFGSDRHFYMHMLSFFQELERGK
jgi:DNA polymerase III gamma/tau subunit